MIDAKEVAGALYGIRAILYGGRFCRAVASSLSTKRIPNHGRATARVARGDDREP